MALVLQIPSPNEYKIMAILHTQKNEIHTDLFTIQRILSLLDVQLNHWPIAKESEALLSKPSLKDHEKTMILSSHQHYFETLKKSEGYQSQDLIVLHPEIPNLEALLEKFASIHTHDDNEVRYIVDGEGTFGFVLPDGSQILLTVVAGEFINVPAHTEHWFVLTQTKRIKAVRYFTTTDGWSPNYTNRLIEITA